MNEKFARHWWGGKWIVSLASLQNFYEQAKIEEEILAERLRQERLAEQIVSDFIFENRASSFHLLSTSQKFFSHAVSVAGVVIVGVLFFISPSLFNSSANVAQLLSFNQPADTRNVTTLEVVEVTAPIDVENGILLFPKQAEENSSFDPTSIFSDEVEVVEDEDGTKYVRSSVGGDILDIPFVDLPSGYQYYQEVVSDEVPSPEF